MCVKGLFLFSEACWLGFCGPQERLQRVLSFETSCGKYWISLIILFSETWSLIVQERCHSSICKSIQQNQTIGWNEYSHTFCSPFSSTQCCVNLGFGIISSEENSRGRSKYERNWAHIPLFLNICVVRSQFG